MNKNMEKTEPLNASAMDVAKNINDMLIRQFMEQCYYDTKTVYSLIFDILTTKYHKHPITWNEAIDCIRQDMKGRID